MTKRLFVVVNPTQYLNAVEYVYQQGSEDDHMVIITPFSKGIEELDKIGANKFWKSVQHLDTEPYRKTNDKITWNARWKFLYSVYKDVRPDELIVGNIIDSPTYPFVLREKKKINSITVLDDGTPTLGVARKRREGGFYLAYNYTSFRVLVKTLLYLKTFPPFIYPPKQLTFFTSYNSPLGSQDKRIVNDFSWLKSKVVSQEVMEDALFIGSNLVDRGLVRESDYLQSLHLVKEDLRLEGRELRYCHHRGESESIRQAIRKVCRTVDFDMPLELAFLDRPRPALVLGHFTSALFTLSRIYPDTLVRAYLFSENQLIGSEYEPLDYLLLVQETLKKDSRIESRNLTRLSNNRPVG